MGSTIQGLAAKFGMGGADAVTADREALGAVYGNLQQQASLMAYADNFRMLGYLSMLCIPLVLLMARPQAVAGAGAMGE